MLEIKKQNLIKILEELSKKWEKAEWLIILIETTNDEKLIDILISTINSAMKTIKDDRVKEKMWESIKLLNEMKAKERLDYKKDLLDAEDMLKTLDF